jgi:hypothetical protein
LPPTYTDLTILDVILYPAAGMPHYPPLYGYLTATIHRIANGICDRPPGPSDCAIFALVLLQQATLVASIVYFAIGTSQTLVGRIGAALPFIAFPVFALVNHGFRTDALLISSLIFVGGTSVRIARDGEFTRGTVAVLFTALLGGLLVKPIAVFAMPLVVLPSVVARRVRVAAKVVLLCLCATLAAAAVNWSAMKLAGWRLGEWTDPY